MDYTISEIDFHGNETLTEQSLIEQMNTRSPTFLEKITFWEKNPEFSPVMFENDMERLHHYYQRHGFLNPHLDYSLKQDDRKEKMDITIDIKEGTPIKIRKVQFKGQLDSAAMSLLAKYRDTSLLKSGDRFIDKKILDFEREIRNSYSTQGYPNVKVERSLNVLKKTSQVDIVFDIETGSLAKFGEVEIKGDSLVSKEYIREKLTFSNGQRYSWKSLDSTQMALFNTDLFRYVVIRGQKDSMQNDRIPVLIEVSEKPTWSLETGVGYGSEDQFRTSVNVTRLRFLGGARKLIFEGKHSRFLPVSLEARFIQPGLMADNLDLIINPFFIREREQSYTVDRLGGGLTFQQRFSEASSGYLMYSLERDFLQDLSMSEFLAREGDKDLISNKSGLTVGFSSNTTKKLIAPVSGWKLNGHFTYMGIGFRSEFHYYKSEISMVRYYQLDDGWIIAGRVRSGFINPLRNESSPIEDRFLLGGAFSMRGWGRHQISPVNEQGKLTGGNSMLEGNMELRFPIFDIFSGVVFTDIGNVWRKAFAYDFNQLRYDAGSGLRVKTPVGPVRLDIASPLFEREIRPQFYISIGHAF